MPSQHLAERDDIDVRLNFLQGMQHLTEGWMLLD
jgi:hypothetical protein